MLARSQHSWLPLFAAIPTIALWNVALAEQTPGIFQDARSLPVSNDLELLKKRNREYRVAIRATHFTSAVERVRRHDEDIRQSGATDLSTVLRRIPGLEVMQMTGADFNVSARGDNQPFANKMLIMVDGRSIYLDAGKRVLETVPVTLPEIKRIEVLKARIRHVWI